MLALTPSSMFRMMSVLGTDYLFAIVVMLVAMGVALFAAGAAAAVIPSRLAVEALGTLFMLWAVFYAYHLIGWGIYRHRDEMG